ncbi:Rieske (2Fe-2S) protein [Galbibacter mesophilus]|uniref:Rieske (2Fe-2S) protein n=1 Tax=Galbibacter mesophilus TaxID=379069 RepID=UPI00191F0737|nr:hypothetical protein [Galbibacter mesophilus]MCM5661838.1 hypothetical protein [Galbibacter mesophilus]
MKNLFFLPLLLIIVTACSSDDSFDNNPFLPEPSFSFNINLNLPKYASLANPGTAVYVDEPNVGIKGVFVYHYGTGTYLAWEASCPNQVPSDCSRMELSTPLVICNCDDYKYELLTGSITDYEGEEKVYPLQAYRVSVNGKNIRIYN